jgi:5-methylcytosine-specific restriction endonuclease McrA
MKIELIILGVTAFLLYNTYHDGKYSKFFSGWKKYIQMATIGLVGISLYIMMKRNPLHSKNLLLCANNAIKYMPIDKSSIDMITPIFDFTSRNNGFLESNDQSEQRILTSGQTYGQKGTKRSVSETKKKYVASNQDWKCGDCGSRLNAWFEVDHKIRLEHGGGNDVNNLIALCRDCHGKKTAMENM